jgi:RHS repeat-associated protein
MKRASLVLLSLLAWGSAGHAQTGTPQFGSLESGGFDIIDHQNLNVLFSIPMVAKPGRGMPLGFAIANNSAIWSTVYTTSWSWVPAGGFGWTTSAADTVVGKISWTYSFDFDCGVGTKEFFYTNYSYTEPNGTVHPFNLFIIVNSQCNGGARTGYATDASGYFIDATVPNSPVVYGPDGMVKNAVGTPTLTDPNGNYMNETSPGGGETDVTDTTGQVVLKQIPGTGYTDNKYQDTSGNWQTLHLITQSFNIKTAFGCANIGEYTSTSAVPLPSELDLPDGTKYLFTYEATPGASGYITGRIKRVTLPSGGYYEYAYPGANDGMSCNSTGGTVANLTRTISNGTTSNTWTFAVSSNTTTVTPPVLPYDTSANVATYQFNSLGQETSRNFYQGAASPSNLLRTINTTWAANHTPASQTTILENNQQSQVQTDYDSNGLLLETREYDLGSGAPGPLVRRTTLTYATIGHIINHPASIIVKDGSGTIKSRTVFGYDAGGAFSGPNCITGAANHNDTSYGCSFTSRGNQTSVTTYTDPVTPSGAITKNFTYDSLGNLRTAQMNCCQQKQFNYSTTTQYAFPDSVISGISPGPQLTLSATYNSFTGLVATSTDANGRQTSYGYDSLKRTTIVTRPDTTQITYAYDDIALTVTSTTPITSSSSAKKISFLDGLGRPIKQQTTDGSGASYSIVETQYDTLGRPYKTSNPHNSTAQYWTESRFDGAGRPTKMILPDSSQTLYSYSGATATITDATGKQRKTQADGLGRIASVYEPDVTNGNTLTQQTSYSYNAFDGLTTVTQGAQTRSYGYDALGRLTDSTTPEAGHFQFQYNTFNLLTQRTDARGVVTTYSYDSLNRPYQVIYNVGTTGVAATPTVTFTYDEGGAPANALGRLTTMADGVGTEKYTYDILGETTQLQKVISGTTYTTHYAYNLAGELGSITYPSGRVVLQNFDAVGRLCAVGASGATCSTGTNYANGFFYNPAGEVTAFNYGNGVAANMTYSPDRLQMTTLSYTKASTTLLSMNYWYKTDATNCPSAPAGNNGQIQCITDGVDSGRNETFTYDALYRLSTAVSKGSTAYPQWGLSFTYDRYGNRTAQTVTLGTGPQNSVVVSSTTNHITGTGYSYDANGNMTGDGSNTMTFDAESHQITTSGPLGSGTYTYDGNGLRVKKVSGSTTTVYLFSGSKVVAEYDNGAVPSSPSREYVYLGSQVLAKFEAGGTTYYHPDHLSNRVLSDSTGTSVGQRDHYPFGENWYESGTTTKLKFTSYERDAESGNDYALARFDVNRLGRFLTPDLVAGAVANPQSLNRYAYVQNDPVNLSDPSGAFVAPQIYSLMRLLGTPNFGSLFDEFDLLQIPVYAKSAAGYPGTAQPATGSSSWTVQTAETPLGPGIRGTLTQASPGVTTGLPANNFNWWGAFASNLFSWRNAKQAQIDAWNKGYYKCLGKKTAGGAAAPVVTHAVGVAATNAAESGASTIAGAYYHFTDGRFTAWGKYSQVLVPNLAPKIATAAKVLDVAGWAYFDYELANAISECSGVLR